MQKISLTVDVVLESQNEILLIRRGNDPFKRQWALPGGFVEADETLLQAAWRELREETDWPLSATDELHFIAYFDDPQRDPRGRIISMAFGMQVQEREAVRAGDDAAKVQWWPLSALPELAFDHRKIIEEWHKVKGQQ